MSPATTATHVEEYILRIHTVLPSFSIECGTSAGRCLQLLAAQIRRKCDAMCAILRLCEAQMSMRPCMSICFDVYLQFFMSDPNVSRGIYFHVFDLPYGGK